jgi:hypothetical protein
MDELEASLSFVPSMMHDTTSLSDMRFKAQKEPTEFAFILSIHQYLFYVWSYKIQTKNNAKYCEQIRRSRK